MSDIRESSHRSLSESQFRWRAAPPHDSTRPHEQGSRGKVKNGSKREPNQLQEAGSMALGLRLPSSVMAYDERGLNLEEHRERPKERRRSDPSDKEAQSTLTLYDPTGRIIPTPKRNSSTISEQPRYQEEHVDVREYRRRNSDQVHSRDYRSTPPPKSALAAGLTESGNAKITSYSHPQVQPRLPASVPPPFQSGQASLDLQPAPSSTSSHIHPAVLQNSAAALSPIRTLYEHAWYQTVSNVQTEMTRMHRELVDAIDRERSAHSRLVEENKALQQDLERVKADLRNAHRDSDQLKDQCDRLMAENERLRQAVKDQIGQNDDQDHQVREAARSYIDEQLGQLKTQYGQQMEKQRAEAERALEQHKVMFEKERRELHKIAVAHERSMQRSGSESASTLVASDTEKVVSPFYDQGLHRNGGQQVSVHHDRPRGHRMSVSSGTKSPASSQTSPQVFSGSLPRCQSGSYRALSPLTPSIPPKEVFSAASPEDLICDLARTGDAVNVDVDVDAKRAVDNLASPIACPIPAPNAALLAMPSTSVHRRPVSSQSPACHLSSSRSPSVPLASIISQPLIDSPSAIGDREQLARPARPSVLPVTIPKARSRRSSLSNQIVQCVTPPMGSLGMRPYSQPPSRSVSRAASPSRPNNVVRPVLKVDVSPVVPPIAMLEELNPPLRQQQEPSSSLKTESQTLALTSAAQIQPQPTRSKSATPQPQQQHPRSVPLPPPPPPLPQQAPLKPQPAQPAQPLKQPTAQYTRFPPSPLPPPPLQPSQPSQNGLQKLPEKSQSQYTYQNYLPVHHQTGSKTWDSYPYTYHYQYSPAPLLPGSAPAPAALQATQSALGSFSTRRKRDRVEYEGDSGAGKRAKTKVKLEDGGGDESMATKVEVKEVKKANKIGITHMDLLYETQGTKMTCRMCRMPSKDEQKETPTMTFPVDAKWIELIGHCQSVHPKLCADLEKLSPSQVQELRQRMQSGKLTGYTLKS